MVCNGWENEGHVRSEKERSNPSDRNVLGDCQFTDQLYSHIIVTDLHPQSGRCLLVSDLISVGVSSVAGWLVSSPDGACISISACTSHSQSVSVQVSVHSDVPPDKVTSGSSGLQSSQ